MLWVDSYLRDHIREALSDFFEDLSDDSVEVGLSSGTVRLNCLSVTPRDISFGGCDLRLERGDVSLLDIGVRWSLFSAPPIEVTLEGVSLYLRLRYTDRSFFQELKMDEVLQQQATSLGDGKGNIASSMISRWLQSLFKRLVGHLIKFVAKATFVLKDLTVFLLVPCSEKEHMVVRLHCDSLVMTNPDDSSSGVVMKSTSTATRPDDERFTLSKGFELRHASLAITKLPISSSSLIPDLSLEPFGLVVSPVSVDLGVKCHGLHRRATSTAGARDRIFRVTLDVNVVDVDVNLSLSQLQLVGSSISHLKAQENRPLFAIIREQLNDTFPRHLPRDARDRWRLAFEAVRLFLKETRLQPTEKTCRELYPHLYRRYLLAKLDRSSPDCPMLSRMEQSRMYQLEEFMSVDLLVELRSVVDKEILTQGISQTQLLDVMIDPERVTLRRGLRQYTSDRLSVGGARISSLKGGDDTADESNDDSADESEDITGESSNRNITLLCNLTFTRISLGLYAPLSLGGTTTYTQAHSSPLASRDGRGRSSSTDAWGTHNGTEMVRACTLVIQGLRYTYESTGQNDRLFSIFLGALQLYGLNNHALITFGDAERFSQCESFEAECLHGNPALAMSLSLTIGRYSKANSRIGSSGFSSPRGGSQGIRPSPFANSSAGLTDSSRPTNPNFRTFCTRDVNGDLIHVMVELTDRRTTIEAQLNTLQFVWDQASITHLLQLDLFPRKSVTSSSPSLPMSLRWPYPDRYRDEMARLLEQSFAAKNTVFRQAPKVSINITLRRVLIVFPLYPGTVSAATTSGFSASDSSTFSPQPLSAGLGLGSKIGLAVKTNSNDPADSVKYEASGSKMRDRSGTTGKSYPEGRKRFLALEFERFSILSETYLDNLGEEGFHHHESLWKIVQATRNPLVAPRVFSVEKVCIRYVLENDASIFGAAVEELGVSGVNGHQNRWGSVGLSGSGSDFIPSVILLEPWECCGVWSVSSNSPHRDFVGHRLDFFGRKLCVSLDAQDMVNLLFVTHQILDCIKARHGTSHSTPSSTGDRVGSVPNSRPRVARLANLSLLYSTVSVEGISLSLVDRRPQHLVTRRQEFTRMVESLLATLRGIKYSDDVVITQVRRLAWTRFNNFGLRGPESEFCVERLIELTLDPKSLSQTDAAKEGEVTWLIGKLRYFQEMEGDLFRPATHSANSSVLSAGDANYLDWIRSPGTGHSEETMASVIFHLSVREIDWHRHDFYYDALTLVGMRELLVYDARRVSLLEVRNATTQMGMTEDTAADLLSTSLTAADLSHSSHYNRSNIPEHTGLGSSSLRDGRFVDQTLRATLKYAATAPPGSYGDASLLEMSSQAGYAAFVAIKAQSPHYGFATGGSPPSILLEKNACPEPLLREVKVSVGVLSSEVNVASMCAILESLAAVQATILTRVSEFSGVEVPTPQPVGLSAVRRRSDSLDLLPPLLSGVGGGDTSASANVKDSAPVSFILSSSVATASFCVVCEDRMFAAVELRHALATFWHDSKTFYKIGGEVSELRVLDLTDLGHCHRQVVWKEDNLNTRVDEPMIRMHTEITTDNSETKTGRFDKLKFRVSHLRICLLHRFINEAVLVAKEHVVGKVVGIYRQQAAAASNQQDSADSGFGGSNRVRAGVRVGLHNPKYLSGASNGKSKNRNSHNAAAKSNASMKSNSSTHPPLTVELEFVSTSIIVPRSSMNLDVVGLAVQRFTVSIFDVDQPWVAPTAEDISTGDSAGALFFDVPTNRWRRSVPTSTPASKEKVSSSKGNNSSQVNTRNTHERRGSAVSDDEAMFFDCENQVPNESFKVNGSSHPNVERIAVEVTGLEIYVGVFHTSFAEDVGWLSARHSYIGYGELEHLGLVRCGQSGCYGIPPHFVWIKISQQLTDLLVVYDTLPISHPAANPISQSPGNTNGLRHPSNGSSNGHSNGTDKLTKFLLGDLSRPTQLGLSLTLSEYHTLLGYIYSNMEEQPRYLSHLRTPIPAPVPPKLAASSIGNLSYGTERYAQYLFGQRAVDFEFLCVRADVVVAVALEDNVDSRQVPYGEDGALSGLTFFDRHRLSEKSPAFNVKLNRKEQKNIKEYVTLLSTERNILRRATPLSVVRITGLSVHCVYDFDVSRVFVAAGSFTTTDVRLPQHTHFPVILSLAASGVLPGCPHATADYSETSSHDKGVSGEKISCDAGRGPAVLRYHYVESDFEFGFRQTGESFSPQPSPVQISYVSSTMSNWATTHVAIHEAELTVHRKDIIMLTSDFFSVYFRLPEFGSPSLAAYTALAHIEGDAMPYGGHDVRVFITKPHFSFLRLPLEVTGPAIFLESEAGIYVRYTYDTAASWRVNFRGENLALVLATRFRPRSIVGGSRGSSGSSTGVCTIAEFFSLRAFFQVSEAEQTQDLVFELLPYDVSVDIPKENEIYSEDEEDEEDEVEKEVAPLVNILEKNISPSAMFPKVSVMRTVADKRPSLSTVLDREPCDFVLSLEDFLFLTEVFNNFTSSVTPASSPQSSNDPSVPTGTSNASPAAIAPINSETTQSYQTYITGMITNLRVLLVDNVLGMHLPLFQVFLEDLEVFSDARLDRPSLERFLMSDSLGQGMDRFRSFDELDSSYHRSIFQSVHSGSGSVDEWSERSYGLASFWVDYFNNLKKCWEPLTEKLHLDVMYERSPSLKGLSVRFFQDVHLNLTGALIRTIYDAMRMMKVHSDATAATDTESSAISLVPNRGDRREAELFGKSGVTPENSGDLSRSVTTIGGLGAQMISDIEQRASHRTTVGEAMDLSKESFMASSSAVMLFAPSSIPSLASTSLFSDPTFRSTTLLHIPSNPLDPFARVGFSILNLTGQPVRYFQQWEGATRTVQYIANGERGVLNFVPAQTLMRNNRVVEETFEVQQDRSSSSFIRGRSQRKLVGNRVALQVAGYRWIHSVQADELGTQYETLTPLVGRWSFAPGASSASVVAAAAAAAACGPAAAAAAAAAAADVEPTHAESLLRLMVEVVPYRGGRMLRLRSLFTFRNNTRHSIDVCSATTLAGFATRTVAPLVLSANDQLHLPIALLYRSQLADTSSLGFIRIRPNHIDPVIAELSGRTSYANRPMKAEFCNDAIDLLYLTSRTPYTQTRISGQPTPMVHSKSDDFLQLSCDVLTQSSQQTGSNSAPLNRTQRRRSNEYHATAGESLYGDVISFSYCVEVERNQLLSEDAIASGVHSSNLNVAHSDYTITIHPPIIVENLLPTKAVFEIENATTKKVMWSACVEAGALFPIHTVPLDVPLMLTIHLRYCRSDEAVLFHTPRAERIRKGLKKKLQSKFESSEEGDQEVLNIILSDQIGQKLRLHIENTEGGGGQRHLVVYCPYWIVNTSQCAFRIRQEGSPEAPAGTVSKDGDGTQPVASGSITFPDDNSPPHIIYRAPVSMGTSTHGNNSAQLNDFLIPNRSREALHSVFPGCCGPLHSSLQTEIPTSSPLVSLFGELSFKDIRSLSYMFSYLDDKNLLSYALKAKIQLDDTDWSRPVSLDNVGVTQVISIDHPTRGLLEVGFKTTWAPGRLSKYTKILRFMPRFSIVSRLPYPINLRQTNGFGGGVCDVPVGKQCFVPFHLPSLFGDRKLAIQVEGQWKPTVPFAIDQSGSFTLEVKRQADLASIPHLSTREDPYYEVTFHVSKTLGITFETDWGERNIVVRELAPNSLAANNTDIKVGDVLVAVNETPVDGSQFDNAMRMLRETLAVGCKLKLQTVEEKLRVIREEALLSGTERPALDRRRSMSVMNLRSMANTPVPTIGLSPTLLTPFSHVDSPVVATSLLAPRHNRDYAPVYDPYGGKERIALSIELRHVESSVAVIISETDPKDARNVEYRIENRSLAYTIHFKQKGVVGTTWSTAEAGQVCPFVFDDPFMPHKIHLLIGVNVLSLAYPPSSRSGSPATAVDVQSLSPPEGIQADEITTSGGAPSGSGGGTNSASITDRLFTFNLDELGTSVPLGVSGLHAYIKSDGPTKVLMITCATSDLYLMSELAASLNLANLLTQRLAELINEIDTAARGAFSFSDLIENVCATIDNSATSISSDQQKFLSIMGTDVRPSTSSGPIERLYPYGIDRPRQLIVDVLEAKELPKHVRGRTEDIYCSVRVHHWRAKGAVFSEKSKSLRTYVCEQTIEPVWLEQRFVFDLSSMLSTSNNDPTLTETQFADFSIFLKVKTKSFLGVDSVIAKLDIPLKCLRDESVVEGWFPLRPAHNLPLDNSTGSIKLRLQWVHSRNGFKRYLLDQLCERKRLITAYAHMYSAMSTDLNARMQQSEHVLRTLPQDHFLVNTKHRDYYGEMWTVGQRYPLTSPGDNHGVTSSQTPPLTKLSLPPVPTTTSLTVSTDAAQKLITTRGVVAMEKRRSPAHRLQEPVLSDFIYERNLRAWLEVCRGYDSVQKAHGEHMRRPHELVDTSLEFVGAFRSEVQRNFLSVFTSTIDIEVLPLEIMHMGTGSVYTKISYGSQSFRSSYTSPGGKWFDTNMGVPWEDDTFESPYGSGSAHLYGQRIDNNTVGITGASGQNSSTSNSFTFKIDMLNIRGNIKLVIYSDSFPKSRKIAILELPIYGLLDCAVSIGETESYDRWFPLSLLEDSHSQFSDIGRHGLQRDIPVESVGSHDQFNTAKICLRIRCSNRIASTTDPLEYARLQLPSVSASFIDSDRARSVMLASILDIEFRRAVSKQVTDTTLNVHTFQVDNQLPEPTCSVIISPTPVKAPQPIVRLHMRKRNAYSSPTEECFETIQLVVQELDLRLEQQTVLASWELIKNWLRQRQQGLTGTDTEMSENESLENLFETQQPSPRGDGQNTSNSGAASGRTSRFSYGGTSLLDTTGINGPRNNAVNQPMWSSGGFGMDAGVSDLQSLLEEDVKKLYIEEFTIFPIKINVSFLTTPQYLIGEYRRTDLGSERSIGYFYSGVSVFLWQVGGVVLDLTSSISDAPIFFNGFEAPHLFKTRSDITRILQGHYLHSALGQLYKIVGSLELVGNPIGLLSSLGVGVRDFFYEPAHAIITTPTELSKIGKGVMKGTLSLVSNAAIGFISTGTTITRSIGRGVAQLSMDSSYIKARACLQKHPGTVKDTLLRPLRDVGSGMYYGISGLVKAPYRSTKVQGLIGLPIGMAKGVAGLAANPIIGILDAITHTGDAFRELVHNAGKDRVVVTRNMRPADIFGLDGRVLPFDQNVAWGTKILRSLQRTYENPSSLSSGESPTNSGSYNSPISLLEAQSTSGSVRSVSGKSSGRKPILSLRRFSLRSSKNNTTHISRRSSFDSVSSPGGNSVESSENTSLVQTGAPHYNSGGTGVMECVIQSFVFRRSPATSVSVVLVTNLRVVLVDYISKGTGFSLKKRWSRPINQLVVPTIDHTSSSPSLTFNIRRRVGHPGVPFMNNADPSSGSTRAQFSAVSHSTLTPLSESGGSGYVTEADYVLSDPDRHTLLRLYNCLVVVLNHGEFARFQAEERAIARTEDGSVFIVGCWQFSTASDLYTPSNTTRRTVNRDVQAAENNIILTLLELDAWYGPLGADGMVSSRPSKSEKLSPKKRKAQLILQEGKSRQKPEWLIVEEIEARKFHDLSRDIFSRVARLYSVLNRLPEAFRVKTTALLDEFKRGRCSYEEFCSSCDTIYQSSHEPVTSHSVSGNIEDETLELNAKHSKPRRWSIFQRVGGSRKERKKEAAAAAAAAAAVSISEPRPMASSNAAYNVRLMRQAREGDNFGDDEDVLGVRTHGMSVSMDTPFTAKSSSAASSIAHNSNYTYDGGNYTKTPLSGTLHSTRKDPLSVPTPPDFLLSPIDPEYDGESCVASSTGDGLGGGRDTGSGCSDFGTSHYIRTTRPFTSSPSPSIQSLDIQYDELGYSNRSGVSNMSNPLRYNAPSAFVPTHQQIFLSSDTSRRIDIPYNHYTSSNTSSRQRTPERRRRPSNESQSTVSTRRSYAGDSAVESLASISRFQNYPISNRIPVSDDLVRAVLAQFQADQSLARLDKSTLVSAAAAAITATISHASRLSPVQDNGSDNLPIGATRATTFTDPYNEDEFCEAYDMPDDQSIDLESPDNVTHSRPSLISNFTDETRHITPRVSIGSVFNFDSPDSVATAATVLATHTRQREAVAATEVETNSEGAKDDDSSGVSSPTKTLKSLFPSIDE